MADRAVAREVAVLLLSAVVAAFVAVMVVRPLAGVQVGFDTAASVIHFQRLVAGERLEAFVTTTPKPILTVIDGVLHAVGGWTAVAWAAIAIHGLATGLAALLASRVAGLVAAAFVAIALAGNSFLLVEASYAYAVPWALAFWCLAGLAVVGERPRFVLAGLALLLATLARFETVVLLALIAAVTIAWALVGRWGQWPRHVPPMPAAAWALVVLPGLALPIMFVHDWLLTGDPLFWATVSARYTAAAREQVEIAGPAGVAASQLGLVLGQGPAALLALGGVIGLVLRRCWPVVVGVAALGPGMIAFLIALAVRGTYVSGRYSAPIELSILFSAGIAVGLAAGWLIARLFARRTAGAAIPALRGGLAVAAAALAFALVAPWGPMDDATVTRIANERRLQANAAVVVPAISRELDARVGSRDRPPSTASVTVPSGRPPVLFVPGLLRPRLAVDLGLPVDIVAGLPAGDPVGSGPFTPGQIVYFDKHGGPLNRPFSFLAVGRAIEHDGVRFVPVYADAVRGAFVHLVEAP